MGHSWRDMDPVGAEAHDRHIERLLRLREGLKNVPLSEFTVGDLPVLIRLMGAFHNSAGQIDPSEEELRALERVVHDLQAE